MIGSCCDSSQGFYVLDKFGLKKKLEWFEHFKNDSWDLLLCCSGPQSYFISGLLCLLKLEVEF